ncbi:ankyrin repeat and MYND domain-containing protein [Acrasis kona]|uniref:Ankyrin repeat and MYND domain-containing protein n=1 Tax=Acrasis kona TaxID=1008807 RepID=A0AAW2YWH0_9EUKA
MNTPPRQHPSPHVNDRLFLWLKFCSECKKIGADKWCFSELLQICKEIHYCFGTILQTEEQKRQRFQLMQLQQQLSRSDAPSQIHIASQPDISVEQLQLLHNSFDVTQNAINNELSEYAKSISLYVKQMSNSLPDMKQFLQQQQLMADANIPVPYLNDNPIQFCWQSLTSHRVKFDAEKVIYSLSTAYYTLFNEYDLDQFYYTGLNRSMTLSLDTSIFEDSDEESDDDLQQIIPKRLDFSEMEDLTPNTSAEVLKRREKPSAVITSLLSSLSFVLSMCGYNYYRPIIRLKRNEVIKLGAVGSASFVMSWIVITLLGPLFYKWSKSPRVNKSQLTKQQQQQPVVRTTTCKSPQDQTQKEVTLSSMLERLKQQFITLIRLIKRHTDCMLQIEMLIKKLNERQLFLDCSKACLTPVKRRRKSKDADLENKNIEEESTIVSDMLHQVSDEFLTLNEKIKNLKNL